MQDWREALGLGILRWVVTGTQYHGSLYGDQHTVTAHHVQLDLGRVLLGPCQINKCRKNFKILVPVREN